MTCSAETLVILNPSAKSERALRFVEQVTATCVGAKLEISNGTEETRSLAESAADRGFKTVVAAGGDGTVNEVVNAIAGKGVRLGLLPLGTMNVFATELGLPANDLAGCWDVITKGRTRLVDLPSANGRHFVQMGGVGLDAQTVQETSHDFKKQWGPLSYVINAAQIASRTPPHLTVTNGNTRQTGSFVLIGNGRFYGGPFVLFKDARLDDGLLDVLIFRNLGYLDIVRYLQAILFGMHPDLSDVDYFQAQAVTVSADEVVPVEVDGDVIGNVPVTFALERRSLEVLAPVPVR